MKLVFSQIGGIKVDVYLRNNEVANFHKIGDFSHFYGPRY